LDDNQKIANSLVSLLKAVPDPTGISQGRELFSCCLEFQEMIKAGYAVFRQMMALDYQKSGKMFELAMHKRYR
jgi:hypothetical protein